MAPSVILAASRRSPAPRTRGGMGLTSGCSGLGCGLGFNWKGKRARVTGAGRGIGRGIADVLAERGADIVVNDVDRDQAIAVADMLRSHGVRTLAVQADVSKRQEVEPMF